MAHQKTDTANHLSASNSKTASNFNSNSAFNTQDSFIGQGNNNYASNANTKQISNNIHSSHTANQQSNENYNSASSSITSDHSLTSQNFNQEQRSINQEESTSQHLQSFTNNLHNSYSDTSASSSTDNFINFPFVLIPVTTFVNLREKGLIDGSVQSFGAYVQPFDKKKNQEAKVYDGIANSQEIATTHNLSEEQASQTNEHSNTLSTLQAFGSDSNTVANFGYGQTTSKKPAHNFGLSLTNNIRHPPQPTQSLNHIHNFNSQSAKSSSQKSSSSSSSKHSSAAFSSGLDINKNLNTHPINNNNLPSLNINYREPRNNNVGIFNKQPRVINNDVNTNFGHNPQPFSGSFSQQTSSLSNLKSSINNEFNKQALSSSSIANNGLNGHRQRASNAFNSQQTASQSSSAKSSSSSSSASNLSAFVRKNPEFINSHESAPVHFGNELATPTTFTSPFLSHGTYNKQPQTITYSPRNNLTPKVNTASGKGYLPIPSTPLNNFNSGFGDVASQFSSSAQSTQASSSSTSSSSSFKSNVLGGVSNVYNRVPRTNAPVPAYLASLVLPLGKSLGEKTNSISEGESLHRDSRDSPPSDIIQSSLTQGTFKAPSRLEPVDSPVFTSSDWIPMLSSRGRNLKESGSNVIHVITSPPLPLKQQKREVELDDSIGASSSLFSSIALPNAQLNTKEQQTEGASESRPLILQTENPSSSGNSASIINENNLNVGFGVILDDRKNPGFGQFHTRESSKIVNDIDGSKYNSHFYSQAKTP